MKLQTTSAAISVLFALAGAAAHAEPAGPVFPGNEAVRIVSGKRVVEAPPLTAKAQNYLKSGFKLPPPRPGAEVYMVEGPNGLLECSSGILSETGCIPSSLGTSKRSRFWTVKLAGVWLYCESRAPARKCEPASAGAPGGMGTIE